MALGFYFCSALPEQSPSSAMPQRFLKNYPAADGFKSYYESNKGGKLIYHISSKPRLKKLLYNPGMKYIVERFLYSLYKDESFSAPWTDMSTDQWKVYQPRENIHLEKAVGFQLMYAQLDDYRPLQSWIVNQNVYIIHLIRENALKLLISRTVAKNTGQWHFVRNGSKRKVLLDPKIVLSQLDKIINSRERMKKKFPDNRWLEITYENFLADHYKESRRISEFLKMEEAKIEFPKFLKKINPDSLKDVIENYEEIAIIIKKTPYKRFLEI